MKYRNLRIVWSVGCGVVCLLLIALWVRSHYQYGLIEGPVGARSSAYIQPMMGRITFGVVPPRRRKAEWQVRWYKLQNAELFRPVFSNDFLGFSASFFGNHRFVRIPNWFAVFATGFFAGVPWMRWRWHFSLRTLLIGMTVVAAVLGAVNFAAK